ncbi:uncharacterized protein LOC130676751 [Microplitis mediator]|uniref:uncharacterized protein LOC130676751 n=1 Tax=Microplitis mediator TaxID=375433 RepID=UPI0025552921|nr:uncharacterized protein LOC130676751 [Microplitis mediator]
MELIIDFVGFEMPDGRFVMKELCASDICVEVNPYKRVQCEHWLFEPPLDQIDVAVMQKSVDHCGLQHSISWTSGVQPYESLKENLDILVKNARYFYVQGERKKKWLDNLIDSVVPIIDMEKLRHFSLFDAYDFPKHRCPYHVHHKKKFYSSCAYQNVQFFKKWFWTCYGNQPTYEKSVQIFNQLGNLLCMDNQDIACLDVAFIIENATQQIDFAWHKLPERLQNNEKLIGYQRCRDHSLFYDDIPDSLAYPFRKDCCNCTF